MLSANRYLAQTSAEILDDDVRARIAPGRLSNGQLPLFSSDQRFRPPRNIFFDADTIEKLVLSFTRQIDFA